jgi:hypothetical protein
MLNAIRTLLAGPVAYFIPTNTEFTVIHIVNGRQVMQHATARKAAEVRHDAIRNIHRTDDGNLVVEFNFRSGDEMMVGFCDTRAMLKA